MVWVGQERFVQNLPDSSKANQGERSNPGSETAGENSVGIHTVIWSHDQILVEANILMVGLQILRFNLNARFERADWRKEMTWPEFAMC